MKKNKLITVGIVFFLVLAYYTSTSIYKVLDPVLFPELKQLYKIFIKAFPELIQGTIRSLKLLVPSMTISIFLGVSLGLIIGWNKNINEILMPIIYAFSPIPAPLYTPYAIMLLPTFWHSSIFIIFIGSFWSILNGTISGVKSIERRYIENASCLQIRGIKLFKKIVFPAALPSILNGIRSGLNFSFVLLIIAEMFGSQTGLGYFIQYNADFANYGKVLVGIFCMSIFIVIIMMVFDILQKKLLIWRDTL